MQTAVGLAHRDIIQGDVGLAEQLSSEELVVEHQAALVVLANKYCLVILVHEGQQARSRLEATDPGHLMFEPGQDLFDSVVG